MDITQLWDYKPTNWDYYATEVDCGMKGPSGHCSLKFTYPAGNYSSSFSGGRAGIQFGQTDEIWVSHYSYWSPGFVFNPIGTKMDFLIFGYPGDGTNPDWNGNISIGFRGDGDWTIVPQIISGPMTYLRVLELTVQKGRWNEVKYHCKMNTPGQYDGVFEMWVNGQPARQYYDLYFRALPTSHFHTFVHTAEWGGGGGYIPQTQYWWVDKTHIATSPIASDPVVVNPVVVDIPVEEQSHYETPNTVPIQNIYTITNTPTLPQQIQQTQQSSPTSVEKDHTPAFAAGIIVALYYYLNR